MFLLNLEKLSELVPQNEGIFRLGELFELIPCMPMREVEADAPNATEVYPFTYKYMNNLNSMQIRHYHIQETSKIESIKVAKPHNNRFLKRTDFILFNKGFNLLGGLVNECLINHYHGSIPKEFELDDHSISRLYGAAHMIIFRPLPGMAKVLNPTFALILLEMLSNYMPDGFKSLIQVKTINYIRIADIKEMQVVLPSIAVQEQIAAQAGELVKKQSLLLNELISINDDIAKGMKQWGKQIKVNK